MAKAKFVLTAAPTFKAKVLIPVPGAAATPIEFTFKGRTKDQLKTLVDSMRDREDLELVMDIVSGWDLDEPFSEEAVDQLLQNYIGSGKAIISKYLDELTAARVGN